MSLERIIKALVGLGLSRSDAEVYVYLAKKGPTKILDLTKALTCNKSKIHTSLRNLQINGLVTKDSQMFSALPFEEALELLINQEKEKAETMIESKKKILAN